MAEPFLGEIRTFSFGIIPAGWAACNGQLLQVNQNQALFAILGNRFGGDGKTTFALPNLQGSVPLCSADPGLTHPYGGEETHTLTINEIPQHTHQADAGSDDTTNNPKGATWGTPSNMTPYEAQPNTTMSTAALKNAGGSQAHSNMQPYLVFNFCIAVQGIYPPRS